MKNLPIYNKDFKPKISCTFTQKLFFWVILAGLSYLSIFHGNPDPLNELIDTIGNIITK